MTFLIHRFQSSIIGYQSFVYLESQYPSLINILKFYEDRFVRHDIKDKELNLKSYNKYDISL